MENGQVETSPINTAPNIEVVVFDASTIETPKHPETPKPQALRPASAESVIVQQLQSLPQVDSPPVAVEAKPPPKVLPLKPRFNIKTIFTQLFPSNPNQSASWLSVFRQHQQALGVGI